MIEVIYKGRLGNNLFQYALGRTLSKHFGYALKSKPIRGFPKTQEKIEGKVCEQDPIILTGHDFNIDNLKAIRNRKIVLNGHFIRWEYLKGHEEDIRSWYKIDMSGFPPLPKDHLVIHVRGGDYKRLQKHRPSYRIPTEKEYLPFTKGYSKVYVVTDDKECQTVKNLTRRGHELISTNAFDDFRFISSAQNIVFANSTFSWWAAWLSKADNIISLNVGNFKDIIDPGDRFKWIDLRT